MGWARLDDGWHDHPKVIEAGCEAAGLWVMCLTWAHANRRNDCPPGYIPAAVAARFAGTRHRKLAATLARVGLFDTADGGWVVHDFTVYLPKYDPKQASEAGKAGARKRWGKGGAPPPDEPQPDSEPPPEPLNGSSPDRIADESQTHSTRASARRNPEPITRPPTTTTDNSRSGSRVARVDAHMRASEPPPPESDPEHSPAGELAAHYAAGVPLTNHGKALDTIAIALDQGIDPDLIRAGLDQLIVEQSGCTPDRLRIAILAANGNWRPANGAAPPKPSTTDARVEAGLELAAQMRAERLAAEAVTPPTQLRALPGGAA